MSLNALEFEQEIALLDERIDFLRKDSSSGSAEQAAKELAALEKERKTKLAKIYSKLDSWQTCQVARHLERPHTSDYLQDVFTDFSELHGDRMYADDRALIGGLARLDGEPVMVIGHQKGRETEDRIRHNFGMPHPEGYRKALRLMQLAEKFSVPLITLIDTPGAFCGVGAEERGMSQALGSNLVAMASLQTRIIAVVIGEGGSGGAIAIGVADRLMMFEYAVYSVISPEGCASILWKENGSSNIGNAANAMGMRSRDLLKLNLIDEVIKEPVGGAHRETNEAADNLRVALGKALAQLKQLPLEACLSQRSKRLREYGLYSERRR